jgi:hypothetical protein
MNEIYYILSLFHINLEKTIVFSLKIEKKNIHVWNLGLFPKEDVQHLRIGDFYRCRAHDGTKEEGQAPAPQDVCLRSSPRRV